MLLQGWAGSQRAALTAGQQGAEGIPLRGGQEPLPQGGIALQLQQLGAAWGEVGPDAAGVGAEGLLLLQNGIGPGGGPLQQAAPRHQRGG